MSVAEQPKPGYKHVSTTSHGYLIEIAIDDDLPNGAYFEYGDLGFGMGSAAPVSAYFPAESTYAHVAQKFFEKYMMEFTSAHLNAAQTSPAAFEYNTVAGVTKYANQVICSLESVMVKGGPINLEDCGNIKAGKITIKIAVQRYHKSLGNESYSERMQKQDNAGCCILC